MFGRLGFICILLGVVTGLVNGQRGTEPIVDRWAYQLQAVDLEEVAASEYDLIVMDYSADGTAEEAYTGEDLAILHAANKLAIAYMSIGEAEDYRFYWDAAWDDTPPEWLDAENPDWEGNYKVRYWMDPWQNIILEQYLDAIIAAGFDGVYLDIIDAYEYYEEAGRESAGQEMVDFVGSIAAFAHERNPDFLIFPQNGAQLVLDYEEYLDYVDGIGQEDIYYGNPDDNSESPDEWVVETEAALDVFVHQGKWVVVVAYTDNPDQIANHEARARGRGYIPFATSRDLDRLP